MKIVHCEDEPIRIPGKIQSFGYLIGLDNELNIAFYSENIEQLFGVSSPILQKPIVEIHEFRKFIKDFSIDFDALRENSSSHSFHDICTINEKKYYFNVHFNKNNFYLEWEELMNNYNTFFKEKFDFYSYENLKKASEVWDKLTQDIRKYTNYDRVMIYQFLEDGTGKVVAESKLENIESYLHLHYPESDIPKQARELYLTQKRRIFSDVDALDVPIYSSQENVDLSFCEMRTMSPIHGQYLRNAGVHSSFSISIIIEDKLWGLVTCQNKEAKHIDLENRINAEACTAWASKINTNIRSKEIVQYSQHIDQTISTLKNKISKYETLTDGIVDNFVFFADIVESDGVALVIENEIYAYKNTPSDHTILNIINWYNTQYGDQKTLIIDHAFAKNNPELVENQDNIAGLVVTKISAERSKFFFWFRKEYSEHIKWAGKPTKDITIIKNEESREYGISPRKSFELFEEEIKGKSKIWTTENRLSIEKLLTLIFEISYEYFSKIQSLNNDLQEINEELDSFSYTISHDLGTPLTVMKLNIQLLARKLNLLENNSSHLVDSVIEQIDNMEILMRDVLQLSRAKSADLDLQQVMMPSLITTVVEQAKIVYGNPNIDVEILDCPDITSDRTLTYQIFLNIISNAIKYSSKQEYPKVVIKGEKFSDKTIYIISDNGIGIPEEDQQNMFKIFKRMPNAKSFHGNGIGLSIVYRIMQRLGGEISFKSKENQGTEFFITFKN